MPPSQPSVTKRLKCGSNVNNAETNCNTSNTNINLLSLPNEALNHILSYSTPRNECQVWEWIGILSQICRSFRRFRKPYAPTRIVLEDFKSYTRLNSSERFDARIGILRSLRDCSWKRKYLKEFHVNPDSVLGFEVIKQCCNEIRALLRTLLTTPSSFPELEWLDIELQSDHIANYGLVDSESLPLIPPALPALQKLCLSKCFKDGEEEFNKNTPSRLSQFFWSFQTPLTSLSICGPMWITDAHVDAIMTCVGRNLVCLELVSCVAYDDDYEYGEARLTDDSMYQIAKRCNNLESFSMVDSEITELGLRWVCENNPNITTLNLSASTRLWTPDDSAFDIISEHLPRLKEIRNYWPSGRPDWFTDDGLISLVNAQERESGGSGIFLKLIGLSNCDRFLPQLTITGMKHVIEKGVKEIEIDESPLHEVTLQGSIVNLGSDVKLYKPHYVHHIDGSLYEREAVEY